MEQLSGLARYVWHSTCATISHKLALSVEQPLTPFVMVQSRFKLRQPSKVWVHG
jgi:hypothetical protein